MRRSWFRTVLGVIGAVAVLLVAAVLVLVLVPASAGALESKPNPASEYSEAVARFERVRVAERARGVYEPCASRLLQHGRKTDVTVVLVHGLTNCPRQFVELGEQLHAAGANVLILRVPRHGLSSADGSSIGGVSKVGGLTPDELASYGDDAVDIAAGLGNRVRVLGLSMGGVIAAWIAENRRDVDRAVIVAPALTLPRGPDFLNPMFRNLFGRLPNISLPTTGDTLDHAYTGESTRALAAMYRMAESVRNEASEKTPAARSIAVVTNAADDQVDNGDVDDLAASWRREGATVDDYEFAKQLDLPHDVIDVQQQGARPDLVYPVLIGLLGLGG